MFKVPLARVNTHYVPALVIPQFLTGHQWMLLVSEPGYSPAARDSVRAVPDWR